jgi:hypothetical protein
MENLGPLDWLVAASSRGGAERVRAVFALDRKCARAALSSSEPILGQMRLAWWRDALLGRAPAKGEPLVEALLGDASGEALRACLVAIVDGWEEICTAPEGAGGEFVAAVERYAQARGNGVFAALATIDDARAAENASSAAAAAWALWDIAGHLQDERRAAAISLGESKARGGETRQLPRPARILLALARHDLQQGRAHAARLTPGMYLRVIRVQILGR